MIYTDGVIFSKNRSFIKSGVECMPDGVKTVVIDDPCYVIQVMHGNLGHFFHDQFFHLWNLWLVERRKVLVYVKTSDAAATTIGVSDDVFLDFLKIALGESSLILCGFDCCYKVRNIIIPPEGRDLRLYSGYRGKVDVLRKSFINYYKFGNIKRDSFYLYSRAGLERKRLINIDLEFLSRNNIRIVEMHHLNLREQVRILVSAKLFVSMVGAGVFNLIFMDKDSSYIEINPSTENSWALRFGLSDLCRFYLYVSDNIRLASAPVQDAFLDADVFLDQPLMAKVESVIDELH